ncbi:TolC family protein [Parapedobacter tibetensis]|uniref:TolC family protein n=1 Tax=Parapedobacter tibetensis TaxID=2972951 RepID=UPI00214D2831|nr:TolC family protein [Parapedobacter tibetensis]
MHTIRLLPVFLGLTLVLASCKVSKDSVAALTALPDSYRNATPTMDDAIDSLGITALSRADFFAEKGLLALIDTAIAKNNDLQLAIKNLEVAQQLLKQAKMAYLPTVGLSVVASSTRPSNNSLNGLSLNQFLGSKHIEDYSAGASLSWEVDIWGKIRSQKAAALASYLQTEEAQKAVQTQLVANVAQAYYNLLMLKEQLSIAKRNLSLNDTTLTLIRHQYEVGEASLLAIEQAEAQQLAAAELVPVFEQEINLQENALNILLGNMPDSVETRVSLTDITIPQNMSAGIPSILLSRRPDVKSSELGILIADANMRQARASMYPSLTITAQGGVNTFTASNWFNIPASLFGAVAGGLTQPILQKRELKTKYETARIEREKSVIQFRQSILIAVGEVSDALIKLEKLKQRDAIATDRVEKLRSAIANADMLFKNGMANYLEVITAQSNVLQSELELANIKRLQLGALTDLYRAVGGGWQ